jgi:hypothetical protein
MTKEELKLFIELHIPIAVKSRKKYSIKYVDPFSSNYAKGIVIDVLAEKLCEELNKHEAE